MKETQQRTDGFLKLETRCDIRDFGPESYTTCRGHQAVPRPYVPTLSIMRTILSLWSLASLILFVVPQSRFQVAAVSSRRSLTELPTAYLASLVSLRDPAVSLDWNDAFSHLSKILIPRAREHLTYLSYVYDLTMSS